MYRAIIDLYEHETWAAEAVAEARERLEQMEMTNDRMTNVERPRTKPRAIPAGNAAHAGRREQPGAGVRRRGRRADCRRARCGRVSVGRRRQPVHRLRRLVGAAHLGPRASGRGGSGGAGGPPRHELWCTDRSRERAGRVDHRGRAEHRESAARELRHRSHDERDSPGPRLHGPRRDREVRRQLPRARRQPAGRGRQLGRHAGGAEFAGRHRRHEPRYAGAAIQRRGRPASRRSRSTGRGSPA